MIEILEEFDVFSRGNYSGKYSQENNMCSAEHAKTGWTISGGSCVILLASCAYKWYMEKYQISPWSQHKMKDWAFGNHPALCIIPRSNNTLDPVIFCSPGTLLVKIQHYFIGDNHGCFIVVLCPVGSYHDIPLEECVDCPPGMYQDVEGQTDCKACPDGAISNKGAINQTNCKYTCRSLIERSR